jgi:hypothetical protein
MIEVGIEYFRVRTVYVDNKRHRSNSLILSFN